MRSIYEKKLVVLQFDDFSFISCLKISSDMRVIKKCTVDTDGDLHLVRKCTADTDGKIQVFVSHKSNILLLCTCMWVCMHDCPIYGDAVVLYDSNLPL